MMFLSQCTFLSVVNNIKSVKSNQITKIDVKARCQKKKKNLSGKIYLAECYKHKG